MTIEELIHQLEVNASMNDGKVVANKDKLIQAIRELDRDTIVSELEKDISKKVIKLDKNIRTVIYCVGFIVPGNIRKVSTTDFKKSLSTNLIGAYCLAEQMIDYFLNNKAGHFIFLSSIFGHVVGPNLIN